MNLISSFTFPLTLKFYTVLRSLSPPSTFPSLRSRVSALPPPHPRSMNTSAVAPMASSSPSSDAAKEPGDLLVQYVVLRRDLIDEWPLGSTVTQGCHAAVAAIWDHRDRIDTAAYLSASNLDSMNKVTLEVKGETQIRKLAEKLTAEGIEHKLWIEQPENIPTCLATRPYPKSFIASYFKKIKLCK
ncbi:putative peptidyl-tRNA hydrolase PTRHD1 [Dendrobium catenatum]|uniref:putative peptidyl-tRNA hydrolase PTRHD1 n=1 Tax=Dendrobium catenatum TaxID=906689 RepID=UPI00109F4600|nr:putative peptidyl-tRNA hydrolase PTRHD1 [Dendrobium catenatum]